MVRPFRCLTKNGNSTCSRYHSDWFAPNDTNPTLSPAPRDQLPCVHGPMTMALLAPGLSRSMVWYVLSGPCRSSASNQPPTVSTAGLMFLKCFQSDRACQNAS